MKRQAVLLFQGNENGNVSQVDLSPFVVQLFYVDSDGDKILICNLSDLSGAIEEGNGNLGAIIKVHASVAAAPATKATQTAARSTAETGTQPNPGSVADALADLMHSVAVTAQAGVEAAAQAAEEAHRDHRKTHAAAVKASKVHLKRVKAATKEQIKEAARQAKDSAKLAKKAAASSKEVLRTAMDDQRKEMDRAVKSVSAAIKESTEVDVSEPPPFIHGRHTCDLCLTSPILGKRFHATNLPDYDLCEACHDNYKGEEITFEETALDRDRPMQQRWRAKYSRMLQLDGARARRQAGRRGPPPHALRRHVGARRGPPHFGQGPFGHRYGPHGPPPPPHWGPPPHGAPMWGAPGCGMPPPSEGSVRPPACGLPPSAPKGVVPPPPLETLSTEETTWDSALAEAVRRSLEDCSKESPKDESSRDEKSVDIVKMDRAADAATEATEEPASEQTEVPAVEEKEAPVGEEAVEPATEVKEEPAADKFDRMPSFRIVKHAPEATEESAAKKSFLSLLVEPVSDIQLEDVDSVVQVEGESKPAAVEEAVNGNDSNPSETTKKNDSFSSDAVDSGSVAKFMGETLDRFSEAIDSLNSEMGGATIVDGEPGVEDDDDSSKNSWSVIDDEQTAQDESLARAAVTIGSALFNSDNNISSGHVSHISSITSAPTEVPSVSPAQLDRWSVQLQQLHEMGFYDDAKNVEIMEMLAAANIGSNEDEEVTVAQVLNHSTPN